MIEKVKTYFERLECLSTEELDRSTEKLVRAEKRNVALVIAHIAEMSRRRGHVERGYKSLWDYCTRRLNLSESSVARRIQVANVCRRFPQILVALAENRLSLSVAGLLAPILTDTNIEKLLEDCGGMTKREAEEYLVALRPKPVFEPSIRRASSLSASTVPPTVQALSLQPTRPQTPRPVPRVSPSILEPARPETFNFRFAADRNFKEKFERLAEVLGVENPLQHMAEIMEQAMDIALDKKDVKRKRARRFARNSKSTDNSRRKPCPGKVSAKNRYIPSHIRERVHERAGYQCQYEGPDGTRCRSRTGLELEHVLPFALYRSHDEKYLRLLCGPHNRLAAEKVFGAAFIQEKNRCLSAEVLPKRPGRLIVAAGVDCARDGARRAAGSEWKYAIASW